MLAAIQFVENASDEAEARVMLAHLKTQVCYIGGRVLPPGPGKPWRVQSFHDSAGVEAGAWLPDGCRLVILPPGFRRALGIAA
jgi:hypothetical protein